LGGKINNPFTFAVFLEFDGYNLRLKAAPTGREQTIVIIFRRIIRHWWERLLAAGCIPKVQ
jgi:hypothetical protein